jgi:hypothetical protein
MDLSDDDLSRSPEQIAVQSISGGFRPARR